MEEFDKYLASLELGQNQQFIDSTRTEFENLSPSEQKSINKLIIDIQTYDIEQLMWVIQPLWNEVHKETPSITKKQQLELIVGLNEYKKRGLDMEYLTAGAGAPGNCVIL